MFWGLRGFCVKVECYAILSISTEMRSDRCHLLPTCVLVPGLRSTYCFPVVEVNIPMMLPSTSIHFVCLRASKVRASLCDLLGNSPEHDCLRNVKWQNPCFPPSPPPVQLWVLPFTSVSSLGCLGDATGEAFMCSFDDYDEDSANINEGAPHQQRVLSAERSLPCTEAAAWERGDDAASCSTSSTSEEMPEQTALACEDTTAVEVVFQSRRTGAESAIRDRSR